MEERILTIPNGITALRALGIPLFLWSYLSLHQNALSFGILAFGAITDYLDGKLARALNQVSKFGTQFDPVIDRAYIAATVIALTVRNEIPLWVPLLLVLRDLWLGLVLIGVNRAKGKVFEVTFLGKSATFNLLYALPIFLLAGQTGLGKIWASLAWAFLLWGIGLYLVTGLGYTRTGFAIIRGNNRFTQLD
jgi:cardiolipin synthase (CMP-forming)